MHRRRFLAAATIVPFLPNFVLAADGAVRLRDLYKYGTLSDRGRSLIGERISVIGYMAPPLKADAKFFVLSKYPLEVCPFCDSAADWPPDILAVYTKRPVEVVALHGRDRGQRRAGIR